MKGKPQPRLFSWPTVIFLYSCQGHIRGDHYDLAAVGAVRHHLGIVGDLLLPQWDGRRERHAMRRVKHVLSPRRFLYGQWNLSG
jgi:hypothetical protein